MGSAGSKAKDGRGSDDEINSPPEDLLVSSLASGVLLYQVDANNYLGRLQDADRFAQLGVWDRLLMLLGRRVQQQKQQPPPVTDEQPEQQPAHDVCSACSMAAQSAAGSDSQQQQQPGVNHRCSTEGSGSDPAAPGARAAFEASADVAASQQDLTTLLRQGFDPAAYEKRQLLSRFTHPEKFGFDPREV